MIFTEHADGSVTIKTDKQGVKLIHICATAQLVLFNMSKMDKNRPAYQDALKLKIITDIVNKENQKN